MDRLIYLRCNTEPVLINNLSTGNGQETEGLAFQPGSIWHDEQGIIRQFSVSYGNNRYGNYFLMPGLPGTASNDIVIRDLADLGIKVADGALFDGSDRIGNLAQFLFEKYGTQTLKNSVAVTNLLYDQASAPMAYIAIDNNKVMFKGILNIRSALKLNPLTYEIRNNTPYTISFETSRDLVNWKSGVLAANTIYPFYFATAQQAGYIRFYNGRRAGGIYRILAGRAYHVRWDTVTASWELIANEND